MEPFTMAAIAIGVALMHKKPTVPPRAPSQEVMAFIRGAARAASVPEHVALAFADVESGLNPRAAGDRDWAYRDGGALYRRHVLANVRLAKNPARLDPGAWHSYGLFQLNAAHFAGPLEHPQELYDARINAQRGCVHIARLLARAKGDVFAARLAYVGCGYDGSKCSREHVAKVRERIGAALERWQGVG